jgi:hypothetical protein
MLKSFETSLYRREAYDGAFNFYRQVNDSFQHFLLQGPDNNKANAYVSGPPRCARASFKPKELLLQNL